MATASFRAAEMTPDAALFDTSAAYRQPLQRAVKPLIEAAAHVRAILFLRR